MRTMLVAASTSMLLATAAWGCDWATAQDAGPQGAAPGSRMQMAQAKTPDSARPARGPQSQVSVPDVAPPATPDNTTAATDQSAKIKQMNQNGASRAAKEGM